MRGGIISATFCFIMCASWGFAENNPPQKKEEAPQINWAPTIPIALKTKGLCIFTDQGLVFIVHDAGVTIPQFEVSSFWSSHTIVPHDQATIHVLKPAMPFSLRIEPCLDLTIDPVLTGDPIAADLRLIKMQKSDNALIFNGIRKHKDIEFVHDGRRFHVVLTSQVDDGFSRQIETRPYYRVLPSRQGLAMQVDADVVSVKTSPTSCTLSTPAPGYRATQHTFWSQVQFYSQAKNLNDFKEPFLSFCQAMQALHKGDGARVIGILNLLKESQPLSVYHPLAQALVTWADYMLGRTCQLPHLLTLDDAANWPGFLGNSPFCHAGFWEDVRWSILPEPVFRRIWEDATQEAHYHQSIASLRTLVDPSTIERSNPLHRDFYKLVVAGLDEPHAYPEMLKNFQQTELSAPACPPDISAWARYQNTKDHVSIWSPFVPLWQLHRDIEGAFQAKRYREVLMAAAATPFNPTLGNVFQAILESKNISHVEKLGLYERFKISLPVATCNQIVAGIVSMWCELDLASQASTLLMSNQSVLGEDVRNRLWLTLAENYAGKGSWADAEHALKQISGHIPDEMRIPLQLQHAHLLWNTGRQDDALKIWHSSSDTPLIEQSARLLMQAARYKEAAGQWSLLVKLKGQEAIRPYAICLWRIKDMEHLEMLQKTNREDAWLQWLTNTARAQPTQLQDALNLAETTLKQAAEFAKA